MPSPPVIKELIERFKFNIEDYKKGNYNETQVRREFIDPFFKALGWDVANEKGYAEAYKDVVHEFSLKTKDKAEAPDYLFRIGGTKKFFVEAKKPSVNLKDDISPAFQLRRYAWSAKLPLSILTDFEELAVYDCRIQPKKTDKSSTARINYFTYEEYIDRWDEIESIFSREAILKGSFDKFAESNKGKRGTAEVDDAFLKEIEKWRELLARNIALRNESLSNRELNFAVQKTIDRIIFLRICEDRGIEDYGQLMNLQNGANVYQRLLQIFTRADEKYNSGLFHFDDEKDRKEEPDKITPALTIDDDKLKEIIKNLYYPDSPYEFSVLPSDILGHVYEQFLGKVIRLTPGHRAVVEEKPEVKKAGGVYYTPTYIVDYIVKNTLGKKLEEIEEKFSLTNRHSDPTKAGKESHHKPSVDFNEINKAIKTASKIKVLDPACGSGSFLIDAYQYLLNWHLKLYSVEISFMKSPAAQNLRTDTSLTRQPEGQVKSLQKIVYQTKENEYRLTTAEKKRILLNNIYGVDIDSQAVEVTKLSLLLKVLEGETEESLTTQLSMFRERALPDLSSNIKCGNSLIGPDFYEQTELDLDEEEHYRINVFDWNEEFKEIMNDGGFDCVIGNPPWVDIKGMEPYLVDYYFERYKSTSNRMNIYATFIEKSIELLNSKGYFGYITPVSFYTQSSYQMLREIILEETNIFKIIRMPDNVFKKVTAETAVTILTKKKIEKCEVLLYGRNDKINSISSENVAQFKNVNADEWKHTKDKIFSIYLTNDVRELLNKIDTNKKTLENICDFCLGITPYDKYKGHSQKQIKEKVFHSEKKKDETFKPLLAGGDISRYIVEWSGNSFISYGNWLAAPREKRFFTNPRILVRQIISGDPPRIYCGYTDRELYNTQSIFNILLKEDDIDFLKTITAVLNSSLITFYHRFRFLDISKNTFQKILIKDAKNFPIVIPTNEMKKVVSQKVDSIMNLKCLLSNAKTPQEKKNLERQIAALDKQIDQLVYELYGLTEDEIKIVEESMK